MKYPRKIILFLLLCICFYAVKKFCHEKTDGFQIVRITSDIPAEENWETSPSDLNALQSIFAQAFRYLDSGGQSYAFLSQDGRIVLKFFKMHHLRQYPWLQSIPLPSFLDKFRQAALIYQRQRLERVFSSCKIAHDELKEETGVLHLHLNPNPELEALRVQIVDKIGIAHTIDLSHVPFVLQYRADNAFKTLRRHLKQQDLDAAKHVVKEIVDFLQLRYRKGIKDLDPAPRRNIGLLENRAIAIDIGSFFHPKEPMSSEEAKLGLIQDTRRMRKWLSKRSDALTAYFDAMVLGSGPDEGK